jgi:hypothetical protein
MKTLIIGFTKLKYMPYMNFYLDNIDKEANDIHLLYWNRDCREEDLSKFNTITLHEFSYYQKDEVPKISKLKGFRKYRRFAKNVLRENCYDFIIVLHTLPGVLIVEELVKRYSGKYILDYRDFTYEGNAPFRKIIHAIVHHASVTFVSSDAFRKYLPADAVIYTSHNILTDSLNHRDEKEKRGIPSDKVRIAFWGFIRHEDINRKIIERLANDNRFELHYYGREQETALHLKKYAQEISATNVFFHGEYKPEDRYNFVCNTDMIHNIYSDTNTMLATGNKFYDGILFHLPQLCMKGSYMGERCCAAGIGLECDPNETGFANSIFSYYNNMDLKQFADNCNKETDKVVSELLLCGVIIRQLIK